MDKKHWTEVISIESCLIKLCCIMIFQQHINPVPHLTHGLWRCCNYSFSFLLISGCNDLSYFNILYLFCSYPYPIVCCWNNPSLPMEKFNQITSSWTMPYPSSFCLSSLTQSVSVKCNRNVFSVTQRVQIYPLMPFL